jgi:hypothetical protein
MISTDDNYMTALKKLLDKYGLEVRKTANVTKNLGLTPLLTLVLLIDELERSRANEQETGGTN